MKWIRCVCAATLFWGASLLCPAMAEAKDWSLAYIASPYTLSQTSIHTQAVQEETYLFLPSSADLSALSLTFTMGGGELSVAPAHDPTQTAAIRSGEPFDLLSLFPDGAIDGAYPVVFSLPGEKAGKGMTIMRSDNLGSMYVTSSDPLSYGREWVDRQDEFDKQGTTGEMAMLQKDGSILYDGKLKEIRGRGNTTWAWAVKKPYQIKLEYSANLLDDGNPDNRDGTWLLLAEAFDATLLRNSVTLDMGKDMGVWGTPEYTPVDLYYDGEYRGYYLVAEKVQVKSGRVDIFNYGKYIEKAYKDVADIESLPVQEGTNEYGRAYQYVEGIQAELGPEGAYLIELDLNSAKLEKSWFSTGGGLLFEVHSPEFASKADVEYLSCLLQEVADTVANHGVHPKSGKQIEEYLDIPSFARVFLVQEFAKTCDFWYTSTFFTIPLGSGKLYAGPLWDFDIAYAMRDTRPYEGGVEGYVPEKGWLRGLMTLPVFQEAVLKCFQEDFLPLLTDVLLGDMASPRQALRPLAEYLVRNDASRRMNYKLWELGGGYNNINQKTLYPTYEENIAYFTDYLQGRAEWMTNDLRQWAGYEISEAWVSVSYRNANIKEYASIAVENQYNNCAVTDVQWESAQDEDKPYQTLYTITVTLGANAGSTFSQEPTLYVNGYPVAATNSDPETLRFSYRFEGPTFAPAIYDDVDYALLYQYDYFLLQNPEVAEECGTDPEDVLDYYVYYGIGEGLRAIPTFEAEVFIANYEKLLDSYYMCDVEMSTLHYLEHAYDEDLLGMEAPVFPPPAGE